MTAIADIIPGIHEKELSELEKKVSAVAANAPRIHIDIADGTLIPSTTVSDPEALARCISSHPECSFEAHLLVANPETYIRPLVAAGFTRLIAHIESTDPRLFLDEARLESAEVGLAIDAPTEIEQFEPLLEEIDVALVMSAEAGPPGGQFLPETMEKIRTIRKHFADLAIEVEGGITPETTNLAQDAGVTRIVVGALGQFTGTKQSR